MQGSVLNLGEKIVLASRLAAIEHVRQVMAERGQFGSRTHDDRSVEPVAGPSRTVWRSVDAPSTAAFIAARWNEFYRRAERGAA